MSEEAKEIVATKVATPLNARAARKPGVVTSWEEKLKDLPPIVANEELVRRIWEENDALAHMYIWQLLLSF